MSKKAFKKITLVRDRQTWTCHDLDLYGLWDRQLCCMACHTDVPTECIGVQRFCWNETMCVVLCSSAYEHFFGPDAIEGYPTIEMRKV